MGVPVRSESENKKALLVDHDDSMIPAVTMKKDQGRRCFSVRLVCFISISLLLVLSAITVIYFLKIFKQYVNQKGTLKIFCCECSELAFVENREISSAKVLEKRVHASKLQCCGNSPEQYLTIMRGMQEKYKTMTLLRNYQNRTSQRITSTLLNRSPVAAHVLAGFADSMFPKNTKLPYERRRLPIIELLPERSLSLLKQVNCERDRIIIHSKGIYLVYSQLYMKAIHGTNWPDGWKLLVHVVERYNKYLPNGGEEKLLQSVHTLTESPKHKDMSIDFHTSYTSGVFELEEGDELYIRVNSTDVISRNPSLNYIGVVMLSD